MTYDGGDWAAIIPGLWDWFYPIELRYKDWYNNYLRDSYNLKIWIQSGDQQTPGLWAIPGIELPERITGNTLSPGLFQG